MIVYLYLYFVFERLKTMKWKYGFKKPVANLANDIYWTNKCY